MINDSTFDLGNLVNVDKKGSSQLVFECSEIFNLNDGIALYSSPCGKERNLPVVKEIEGIKFCGVIYIVRLGEEL